MSSGGPLVGVTVVELGGIGPSPFCGMMLADHGADVVRVDRADLAVGAHTSSTRHDMLNRGKRSIAVDVKNGEGVEVVLRLAATADVLIEGFRPGVAERLGLGPDVCHRRNPALVYGRMTGWGQDGPLAPRAGHDIDYIALSGVLGSIGSEDVPTVPLNLVGDFGGGGMLLALGVVSALLGVRMGRPGQVVDAAMVDGSALLMTSHHGYLAEGWWSPRRHSNPLDGAAPFYTTYRTIDGGHMAVGALEPRFYAELLRLLELDPADLPDQNDRSGWPRLREAIGAKFASKTREEWTNVFEEADACVGPVLDMSEAPNHPHNRARSTFIAVGDVVQPAPAPRFTATPATAPNPPPYPGEHTDVVLDSLGYSREEVGMLRASRAVA
ncbi:MAG: CoA transferase [Actinobacteria bacterium]|nr:CoA transferase [Actinomycetota bacterium]MCI0543786.1 CoA transferase [Actinomycetota bacterium]